MLTSNQSPIIKYYCRIFLERKSLEGLSFKLIKFSAHSKIAC